MTRQTPLSSFAEQNKPAGGLSCAAICFGIVALIALFIAILILANHITGSLDKAEKAQVNQGGTIWIIIALAFVVFALLYAMAVYRRRTPFYNQNHLDYQGSKVVQEALPNLVASDMQRSTLNINTNQTEVAVFRGLLLGEVSRHFDSQTSASIEGWLNHNLQTSGRAVSYQLSRSLGGDQRGAISVGDHSARITGQSSVHLTFTGTTRDNLLADGFVAVLEYETAQGWMDTLRVVVPSEPAMREYLNEYIATLGQVFPPGSHRQQMLGRGASASSQNLSTDVSYVSDRLSAILRMPPEKRPPIAVVGTAVTEHAIVGGAMQFGNDGNWYQLFPISLIQKMNALVERSASQPALPS